MKIVLTASAAEFDAAIDQRFGRAAYLLVVETDSGEWQAYENPGLNASGGAGIKVAQYIAHLGVQAAVSGEFGPNAFEALEAAGIAMYLFGECATTEQALEAFRRGVLPQAGQPSGPGHHGK